VYGVTCHSHWKSQESAASWFGVSLNMWTRASEMSGHRIMKRLIISATSVDPKILCWFIDVNMMICNLVLLLVTIYTVFRF
jgi:hypothetical protein